MDNIQITDKLLSFVIGTKCSFLKVSNKNNVNFIAEGVVDKEMLKYVKHCYKNKVYVNSVINLDTFFMIFLSKIEDSNLKEMRIKGIEEMEEYFCNQIGDKNE